MSFIGYVIKKWKYFDDKWEHYNISGITELKMLYENNNKKYLKKCTWYVKKTKSLYLFLSTIEHVNFQHKMVQASQSYWIYKLGKYMKWK